MSHTTTATVVLKNATTIRFNVIKESVDETTAMAKALMIESVKRQMRQGIAHFVYRKKNGEIREAFGTTNPAVVAKHTNGNGVTKEMYTNTAYFDIEKGGWRSFRWESIIKVF